MTHPLDNPIWNALTTEQTRFAVGNGLARAFHPEVSVLAGMPEPSEAAWAALADLAEQRTVAVFLAKECAAGSGLEEVRAAPLLQMEHAGKMPGVSARGEIVALSAADVPEMAALVELTKPGPFSARTIEMGTYLGIRDGGRLVAMAGQRLHAPGYVELSAVCAHPDSTGKGYAATLMSALIEQIRSRGETPFLHVRPDNARAIALYHRLGFSDRKLLHLMVLRQSQAARGALQTTATSR